MDAFAIHGGRLSQARAAFPLAPEPWLDLSTGISPWPYPARFAGAGDQARLPDPEELAALEAAAAHAFGLPPACVLATAGAEAGARLLASSLGAGRVGVAEPAYSGHRSAWAAVGAEVVSFGRDRLDEAVEGCGALVLVNPNNPDGAVIPTGRLAALAERAATQGVWLVVDEAFVDAAPGLSVSALMAAGWTAPRLIALRSFGKFYGLPGVRLGFVTAYPDVIALLRSRLGDWPVSADAIAAGTQAYADGAWADAARGRLAKAADRLDSLLRRAGFDIVGGAALFRLAAVDDAAARFRRLAERGVLTRPFAYNPCWLRFGLPAPDQWTRLETALMETAP